MSVAYEVTVERTDTGFQARNAAGVVIEFGVEGAFSPIELLLAALGGCNIVTVEPLTAQRGHRLVRLSAVLTADKVKPNQLGPITFTYDVELPPDDDEAAAVFHGVAGRVHERMCTVSTALERETKIEMVLPPLAG